MCSIYDFYDIYYTGKILKREFICESDIDYEDGWATRQYEATVLYENNIYLLSISESGDIDDPTDVYDVQINSMRLK